MAWCPPRIGRLLVRQEICLITEIPLVISHRMIFSCTRFLSKICRPSSDLKMRKWERWWPCCDALWNPNFFTLLFTSKWSVGSKRDHSKTEPAKNYGPVASFGAFHVSSQIWNNSPQHQFCFEIWKRRPLRFYLSVISGEWCPSCNQWAQGKNMSPPLSSSALTKVCHVYMD